MLLRQRLVSFPFFWKALILVFAIICRITLLEKVELSWIELQNVILLCNSYQITPICFSFRSWWFWDTFYSLIRFIYGRWFRLILFQMFKVIIHFNLSSAVIKGHSYRKCGEARNSTTNYYNREPFKIIIFLIELKANTKSKVFVHSW